MKTLNYKEWSHRASSLIIPANISDMAAKDVCSLSPFGISNGDPIKSNSGVYLIGDFYVGQSGNISRRMVGHIHTWRKGEQGASAGIDNYFEKYGHSTIPVTVLSAQRRDEAYWTSILKEKGYPICNSTSGINKTPSIDANPTLVRTTLILSKSLIKKIKQEAFNQDKKMYQIVNEAVTEYLSLNK
jgi:hypothetical protein